MNSYNIYEQDNEATVLYHAIAESEAHVVELAKDNNVDITGLVIELESTDVKDELRRPLSASFKNALI